MDRPHLIAKPIDLWDVTTFDGMLRAFLDENAILVRDYHATEESIRLAYEDGPLRSSPSPRPENPYRRHYYPLEEDVAAHMRLRTIRAFHYTRLTDDEVEGMRRDGIHLSTPTTHGRRLDALVAKGILTVQDAEALVAARPFRRQMTNRADRFWLTSHPVPISDGGVTLLVGQWGGELTYFWLRDEALIAKVQGIGSPRVVEVAVPLKLTEDSWKAAKAVFATFARSVGCDTPEHAIDVCVRAELPPGAVLAIHDARDGTFPTRTTAASPSSLGKD